jgi:polyhydroxyalkanoate synthesis regulator phasin
VAKDKDKDPGEQSGREGRSRAEAVRTAVEQAFGATAQGTTPVRERAQDLADELVGAASRFREVLEELRPPTGDDIERLRDQVAALERRVAELESGGAAKGASASAGASTAKRTTRTKRPVAPKASGASASPGASTAKRAAPKRGGTSPRGGGESTS